MKILFVASSWLGGSGSVAHTLASCMARIGHEVHVITYPPSSQVHKLDGDYTIHEVTPYSYSLFPFPLHEMSLVEKIIEVCERFDIDIVHAHYGTLFGHACTSALNYFESVDKKPKLVVTFHGTDLVGKDFDYQGEDTLTRLNKTLIQKADKVTVVSENLATLIRQKYDISRDIVVVPNGIKISDRVVGDDICMSNIFIHVSNFRQVKNISLIVRAFAMHAKEFSNTRLILVGDGPCVPEIRQLIEDLSLKDKISMMGFRSSAEISELMIKSRANIIASHYESAPLTVLESMNLGVPSIATAVGGIPDIIVDSQNGLLFCDRNNPEELCNKMNSIMNDSLVKSLSLRCTKNRQQYDLDHVIQMYLEVYQSILSD